ncbi:MAG: CDP-alcohol phosphatidyltransferase family protein [Candidatus Bathyarchaeota archaeon]|nr:MAG: CDP-alcohol phosphatidyltransferase family protein [Candidatus Bathyarchaeota archaeon]
MTIKLWKGRSKLLTRFKERVQLWISYEAQLAHSVGLTPNHVSAIGMLSAIISALLYWNSKPNPPLLIAATIFLLASGFCDALDGALARIYGETTVFGGFLDSLLDRYVDAIIFSGIILSELCEPSWGLAALIGSLLVSYVRARAEAAGAKMETVGIAERAERIIILAVASLLSVVWLEALWWSIIILAILTNLTVLQRVIYFRKSQEQRISR